MLLALWEGNPPVTGGDFLFLYRFMRWHCQPQTFVHVITFLKTFSFPSISGRIDGPHLQITWLDFCWFPPWPWPSVFKVKYGICCISAKNSLDCHETKNRHINWTLGLKSEHQVWTWPWPWPGNFKVKYGICYISSKNGLIATKRKANISFQPQASN